MKYLALTAAFTAYAHAYAMARGACVANLVPGVRMRWWFEDLTGPIEGAPTDWIEPATGEVCMALADLEGAKGDDIVNVWVELEGVKKWACGAQIDYNTYKNFASYWVEPGDYVPYKCKFISV